MTTLVERRSANPILNADVAVSLLVGAGLTVLSYVIALAAGWLTLVNALEAVAVFTSYACTYLCVRQRRVNYVFGVLSTAAYAALFFQSGLLASAVLNVYLVPTLVYGWIRWGSDDRTRPVTRVLGRWIPVYIGVTALAFAGAYAVISALGGQFALTDSIILILSMLAQFLLDNKKIETWFIWIAVNVIAIWQYLSAGLPLAGLQYVFFLANAVWALSVWRASMRDAGTS